MGLCPIPHQGGELIRGLPARFSLKTIPREGFPGAQSPWTRLRRILRNFNNKQLPAVTWITQPTASGQASKAGHAVRKAHSENRRQPEKNE